MNKLAQAGRPVGAGHRNHAPSPAAADAVRGQARQLDAIFKALARKVLVDDDPASELPLRQLRVCLLLYERPHSMTELSRELGVSQSAITQIADRLESAKMVTRGPVGDDRRVRSLQLTVRARNMLRLREDGRIERVRRIMDSMSAERRAGVLEALEALRDASSATAP
jgi:DNA-binding MarR family transcriptional regulator